MPDSTARTAVLEVHDLEVRYGGRRPVVAVDGVSLTVAAAETVALVGESGCGKSSLARAVTGIERRAHGTVSFDGCDVTPLGMRTRHDLTAIQMVFQDPNSSLNPRRRIRDLLLDGIHAAVARGAEGSEPAEWLARVGLDADMLTRYPHQFSGGQKQRIAIARALAARPRLLVADEPISALDASTQTSVAALMRDLTTELGTGLLFISHDLAVVRRIADRTLVMYAGRIVEQGETQRLWRAPEHPYTRALLAAIPEPDGSGTLPRAPSAAERDEWLRPAASTVAD